MLTLEQSGSMAEIRLHRAPVNALDGEMLERLDAALTTLEAGEARVLLIRSEQKVFCAGADLAFIKGLFDAPDPTLAMRAYVNRLNALFDRLERLPLVTVALIEGAALGGGLELALACDLRVVAEEASLGLPEAAVGLLPGAGGTQRLTRLCGPGISARLILAAERISGVEALRVGLAQYGAPRATALAQAEALAANIAKLAPASLRGAKASIAQAFAPGRAGFTVEQDALVALMPLSDTRARVEAFFSR